MARRQEILIAGNAGMWMLARYRCSFAQQQGTIWRIGFLSTRSRPLSIYAALLGRVSARHA